MKSKERFFYIFVICGLVIAFIIFVSLTFLGFFNTSKNQVASIPLGEKITLPIESGANAISLDVSGAVLPGEILPVNLNAFNNSNQDLFIRVKAYIVTPDTGKINLQVENFSDWTLFENNYYYKKILPQNASISIASKVVLPSDFVFLGNYKYSVIIVTEALNSKLDVNGIWGVDFYQ